MRRREFISGLGSVVTTSAISPLAASAQQTVLPQGGVPTPISQTDSAGVDPVPPSEYPSFRPVTTPPPSMPAAWTATVLLHPFSPPLSTDPTPDNPFFQLCVASIVYVQGQYLSAQIAGCSYGNWWYVITSDGTQVSTDGGNTWMSVDMGWSLPANWFGAQGPSATCAGASPLNWMSARTVEWWKIPVPIENSPPAATWMWFDAETSAPLRMMFGYGPPSPTKGDPTQLAFFQMWSFTYFPVFQSHGATDAAVAKPTAITMPSFPGFAVGNPNGYKNFVWNSNFGMTMFVTPVNGQFNPLPTRVLYVWKRDEEYSVHSDRAQSTLMLFTYNQPNPGQVVSQEALLTGRAPSGGTRPPNSATGFLIDSYASGSQSCRGRSQFPFAQQPPGWPSIPQVEATIRATITNNAVVAPNTIVTITSVLFPPALPNYPEATYLWAWYAPQDGIGVQSRPVTFMQSQSGVGAGTSLALTDYFYYRSFQAPISPSNFDIPASCG